MFRSGGAGLAAAAVELGLHETSGGRDNVMLMPVLRLTSDLAVVAGDLVDANRQPSHDELTRLFARLNLASADPLRPGLQIGKVKRVRAIADWCVQRDPERGGKLLLELVATVRGEGGFDAGSLEFIGEQVVANLRGRLKAQGFALGDDAVIVPLLLDNVPEVDKHAVLESYAQRLRRSPSDNPLVTGTGKDLLKATARHVVVQATGAYNPKMGFPGTMTQAYTALGLTPPPAALLQGQGLDPDPAAQLEQALFLAANAVNRLRNAQGSGHGRPFAASVTARQAELATQTVALCAELLLRPR